MDEVEHGSSGEPRGIDPSALSEREREVLDLALAGLSARVVAERLSLTEAMVRSHLSRIYAKLGVGGRVELLARMKGSGVRDDVPSAPPSLAAEPRVPRLRLLLLGIPVLVLLAAGVGVVFAWLRPDLPPSTDLATVSRLVADRQVTSLDLRGDTLFIATLDGRQFRVDGPDRKAVEAIQAAAIAGSDGSHGVSVSAGGNTLAASLAMLAMSLVPVALLALVAMLVIRALRRPPQARLTG